MLFIAPMRSLSILLALPLLACAPPDDPGKTAPTGFYQLAIETVSDDCAPTRSTQAASGLPVLSSPRGVVISYPGVDAGPAATPWSRATVLRRAASPTVHADLDCPGATSTLAIEITDETSSSLEVDLVETWTGVATCAAAHLPARDCRSERILRFDLEEPCEAPCELVPADCDGGCTVDDPAWRCTCDGPLL